MTGGENGLHSSRPALAIPGLFSVPFLSRYFTEYYLKLSWDGWLRKFLGITDL